MNWKTYIGLLVAMAAIVLGALFLWPTEEREPPPTVQEEDDTHPPTGRDGTRSDGERMAQPDDREFARARRPEHSVREDNRGDDGDDRSDHADEQARPSSGDTTDDNTTDDDTTTPVEIPDVGTDAEDHRPWKDPTNQRVLGDKRWMAPISDEEEERIDQVFEKARAARQDPGLSNFDRRLSIETAREIVDACFADLRNREPGIRGRIIVGWTTGAAMGTGWIRNPRIVTNVHLEDAQFEGCILQGLDDASYPADDGNAIEVEYPFFYDR